MLPQADALNRSFGMDSRHPASPPLQRFSFGGPSPRRILPFPLAPPVRLRRGLRSHCGWRLCHISDIRPLRQRSRPSYPVHAPIAGSLAPRPLRGAERKEEVNRK